MTQGAARPTVAASSPLVAALSMYDWPSVRHANDSLWRAMAGALRARGLAADDELQRGRPDGEIWRDGNLLFAQTCGYPFIRELTGHVRLVATPCYAVDGCVGTSYSSHIVVRCGEPTGTLPEYAGRTVAINSFCSQSGFAALHAACAAAGGTAPFFSRCVMSGSHLASLQAVAAGDADLAAIDAVCWAAARRDCPGLAVRLKSIGTTPLTPGLPFITAAGRSDTELDLIRDALAECLAGPQTAEARRTLFIDGAEVLEAADYCAAINILGETEIAALVPHSSPVPAPLDRLSAARQAAPRA
ncbi:MAG TPA: PhnD/SsuA/transferrin family substrate-binding protein [Afifellaceae bacterium]|nr:PhnD/SsuA/transferrin family substrate-binding protein [Afifellaceae bacterium]